VGWVRTMCHRRGNSFFKGKKREGQSGNAPEKRFWSMVKRGGKKGKKRVAKRLANRR